MAEESDKPLPGAVTKLPPIPTGARVQKRPLTRRQLPASSKTPVIYVSSRTPFMSVAKRARKLLDKSLRSSAAAAAPRNATLRARVEALKRDGGGGGSSGGGGGVVVTVMGTGKAVEKTLGVAGWFEQQGDCVVRMRTRTVGTVDDVIAADDVHDHDDGGFGAEDESRVRMLSCLEVTISLK